MKRKAKLQTSKEFSAAVGRALRRVAKVARKTARCTVYAPFMFGKTAKSSLRSRNPFEPWNGLFAGPATCACPGIVLGVRLPLKAEAFEMKERDLVRAGVNESG